MAPQTELDPREGSVEMHNGARLYWKTNEAGGRTYYSDEIGGGVMVWDTCLVDFGTLCEAISCELALQAVARRMDHAEARAYVREQFDSLCGPGDPNT